MPKLSLERFREIKKRTAEIYNLVIKIENEEIELSDEDEEKLELELGQINDELHTCDLSDIPFEEYEGFYDFGFDFSETGANIDFNIIHRESMELIRLKGCNVRNFVFDNQFYDDESFDEDFMSQYPDKFISKELPEEVKQRYYYKGLRIEDIIRYDLYDEIDKGRVSINAIKFFDKVKIDVARLIEPELFEISNFSYLFLESINNYEEEITEEALQTLLINTIQDILSNHFVSIEGYNKMISNHRIRDLIPIEQRIDFNGKDEIESIYFSKDLLLGNVYNNKEMFRGKIFLKNLSIYRYSPEIFEGITEEKVYYLFDNFPDIVDGIFYDQSLLLSLIREIDIEASKEENFQNVQTRVIEILESDEERNLEDDTKKTLERYYSIEIIKNKMSEYDRTLLENIMKYSSQEQLDFYGIYPLLLKDYSVLSLFSKYGLETVMEFDRANGNIFSKNDFELAKRFYDYYFHYAGNIHDESKKIYYRSNDPEDSTEPYSMKDFEECIRRMIVDGPNDYQYSSLQPIDFRNFGREFKERFPRMFLSEDAPQELIDKFYTKNITIEDIGAHPEWISFFEDKDFELGLKKINIFFKLSDHYEFNSLFEMLRKLEKTESNILSFLYNNAKELKLLEFNLNDSFNDYININDEVKNLDDLRVLLETELENKILSGAYVYGEPYIPEFLKTKHPELVLDDDAPKELKAKFYSLYFEEGEARNTANLHILTLQDLVNEEYQKYLVGKSFDLLRNSDTVKNILKIFDYDTIVDFYKVDPSAFELYCLNVENASRLKDFLSVYPEQYAKEELMQGLRISEEEFESKLNSDEDFKAKYEFLKRNYTEDFIRNPGFVLHLEPEKQSRETLRQYKRLSSSNMLHNSNRFSRDSYEQILGHMLGFLGYVEARKLLEVPEIDEETLSRIYEQDEVIKSLYEKKFEVTGELKVISKLLEGFPELMPTPEKITSKATCKLFASLNKKIQAGYDKDITSLITEILEENNISVDKDKLDVLIEKVIKISSEQKLELIRENNSILIDTTIQENQKTKNMLKRQYRNALEYSLVKSEKVDPLLVREYLEKEFSRINENGEAYYSTHVTDHLEELVTFANELTEDPSWSKKLNHSVVQDLESESKKIGKGWIRKITSNLCYKPEKLTYEQAEILDSMIYPKESGLEVETKATIGLKELDDEEKAKVYQLLTNGEYSGLLTYIKAENMFSVLKSPYSENFREFFLKHKDDFIANPDLYTKFTIIASKFDTYLEDSSFSTRYNEGTLTPDDILLKISLDAYPNIKTKRGEHEVIFQSKEGGLEEGQVIIALKLFEDMKKREYQTVPQEQFETKHYRGRIVRLDDPLHFAIGNITNCCQTIGDLQPGESSMIHSAVERNGALFIVEELDDRGQPIGIVSQSWTWRNGNRVCFDNVEIPSKTETQLVQIGGFDELFDVYQEAAKRMIETDRLKLKKLLETGKITIEQYQAMLIKDVTMGLGCDDLIRNLSREKSSSISNVESVFPLEIEKTYTGAHSRTLYSDASSVILIAHNDDFAPEDHFHKASEVGDYDVKYIRPRDIFRRKGLDIDQDKVESISDMIQRTGRKESSFSSSSINISEVVSHFGIHRLGSTNNENYGIVDADSIKLSMSDTADWYVLYEETDKGLIVLESGIDTTNPKTEFDTIDKKMSLSEYTREMYLIMLDSSRKGKPLALDSYTMERLLNLNPLTSEGIISVENNVVTVNDSDKIVELIEKYDRIIDEERRERLTITDYPEKSTSNISDRKLIEEHGETITEESLRFIKRIEDEAYPDEMKTMKETVGLQDLASILEYDSSDLTIARSEDWYIIYGDNEKSIEIIDLASSLDRDKEKSREEMQKYIIEIIGKKAKAEKKNITLSARESTSYKMIQKMLKDGKFRMIQDTEEKWAEDSDIVMHNMILEPIDEKDREEL